MEYKKSRQRAKELGGISVQARWREDHWLLGGWPNQKDSTWIVTDITRKHVLDPHPDGCLSCLNDAPPRRSS